MVDISDTAAPNSQQLNADDLIAGPRTITITRVSRRSEREQPIAINFEGDNGRPYLPCKSMRRVLIMVWGVESDRYIGRALTLYRDPTVLWGGIQVGGIRISHLSDMKGEQTLSLSASNKKRAAFTIKPLAQTNNPERSGTARKAPSDDQVAQPAAPPTSDASDEFTESGPLKPPFLYALTDKDGVVKTTKDGDVWSRFLVEQIEKKPFDAAQRFYNDNREHVNDAYENGGDASRFAMAVEVAWKKRTNARTDEQTERAARAEKLGAE